MLLFIGVIVALVVGVALWDGVVKPLGRVLLVAFEMIVYGPRGGLAQRRIRHLQKEYVALTEHARWLEQDYQAEFGDAWVMDEKKTTKVLAYWRRITEINDEIRSEREQHLKV